jgi:hypothetical protein
MKGGEGTSVESFHTSIAVLGDFMILRIVAVAVGFCRVYSYRPSSFTKKTSGVKGKKDSHRIHLGHEFP